MKQRRERTQINFIKMKVSHNKLRQFSLMRLGIRSEALNCLAKKRFGPQIKNRSLGVGVPSLKYVDGLTRLVRPITWQASSKPLWWDELKFILPKDKHRLPSVKESSHKQMATSRLFSCVKHHSAPCSTAFKIDGAWDFHIWKILPRITLFCQCISIMLLIPCGISS